LNARPEEEKTRGFLLSGQKRTNAGAKRLHAVDYAMQKPGRWLPATAAAAASTAAISGLRLGYVNGNLSAANFPTVQTLDSCFGISLVRHFYESETTLTSSFTILGDGNRNDFAVLGEKLLELSLCSFEGKISYEQFVIHLSSTSFDRTSPISKS